MAFPPCIQVFAPSLSFPPVKSHLILILLLVEWWNKCNPNTTKKKHPPPALLLHEAISCTGTASDWLTVEVSDVRPPTSRDTLPSLYSPDATHIPRHSTTTDLAVVRAPDQGSRFFLLLHWVGACW